MGRYSLTQRWEILKCYFQSDCCVAETVRRLKREFGQDKAPTPVAVSMFVKKVRETGMLIDNKNAARFCPKRSTNAVAIVAKSVEDNPTMSIRQRCQVLRMSYTTVRRIMLDDLGLTACKTTKEDKTSDGNADGEEVDENESDEYEMFF